MMSKPQLVEYFGDISSIRVSKEYTRNPLDQVNEKHIYKAPNNKFMVQKYINGERRYYGCYDTINEAKLKKLELDRNGWIAPEQKLWRNIETITYNYGDAYVIHHKSKKLYRCYVPEYALWMRDCLEAVDWDTRYIPLFEQEYPKYYTYSCYFYFMIGTQDTGKYCVKEWNGKGIEQMNVVCTRVEDALWERDLYFEYGDDWQSFAEDTRPNPYYSMVLPYFPSRRPRGSMKRHKNYDNMINELINCVYEYPEAKSVYALEKLGVPLSRSYAAFTRMLRKHNTNYAKFKEHILRGDKPEEFMHRPMKLLKPDLRRRK